MYTFGHHLRDDRLLFYEGILVDSVNKQHLRDASSMRYSIYEIQHHLQSTPKDAFYSVLLDSCLNVKEVGFSSHGMCADTNFVSFHNNHQGILLLTN